MVERNAEAKATSGTPDKAGKPKKPKVSIDPAQRGPGGFDRGQLKGKAPIFRTLKKAGR